MSEDAKKQLATLKKNSKPFAPKKVMTNEEAMLAEQFLEQQAREEDDFLTENYGDLEIKETKEQIAKKELELVNARENRLGEKEVYVAAEISELETSLQLLLEAKRKKADS